MPGSGPTNVRRGSLRVSLYFSTNLLAFLLESFISLLKIFVFLLVAGCAGPAGLERSAAVLC